MTACTARTVSGVRAMMVCLNSLQTDTSLLQHLHTSLLSLLGLGNARKQRRLC